MTSAIGQFAPAAHRWLIAGFGIALCDTVVVLCDRDGVFDQVVSSTQGCTAEPLRAIDPRLTPRTREAFLALTGPTGRVLLAQAEKVRAGDWAGVEG